MVAGVELQPFFNSHLILKQNIHILVLRIRGLQLYQIQVALLAHQHGCFLKTNVLLFQIEIFVTHFAILTFYQNWNLGHVIYYAFLIFVKWTSHVDAVEQQLLRPLVYGSVFLVLFFLLDENVVGNRAKHTFLVNYLASLANRVLFQLQRPLVVHRP